MPSDRISRIRLSFQAKVLIPVLGFLVLLPAITLWILNSHNTRQLQMQTRDSLVEAEAVFRQALDIRARDLVFRYRGIVNEPRFKAAAGLEDSRTLRNVLRDFLEERDARVILYTKANDDAWLLESSEVSLEEFQNAQITSIERAFQGMETSEMIHFKKGIYYVVSVPARRDETSGVDGVLTLAVPVDKKALTEFKSLSRTEIVLFADDSVTVSTLDEPRLESNALGIFKEVEFGSQKGDFFDKDFIFKGEHCLAVAHYLPGTRKIGYLLLSSYERSRQQLIAAHRAIFLACMTGVLVSAAIVWVLIGKLTGPLRELRNSAEAVGHGDFTGKVPVKTNDEFGDLALAFNRMIENLSSSRAQLEATVERLETTQAQLVQSEKLSAVGQFVAGVTHELNNPLAAVVGFAELLEQSDVSEKHRRHLSHIVKCSHRCRKIVQSLLGFARQHPPERKHVSVRELLEGVFELLTYEMRVNNIALSSDIASDLPKLLVDPHQIQQVFLNMLNNARQAIEASEKKGAIHVKAERISDIVRITFRDDGPGIDEKNLARIFDPFFTTKPVGKGTGLGLSLCYGIIKEHNGTIRVQSKVGEGTSFFVELPLPSEAEMRLQPGGCPAQSTVEKRAQGKQVLVIDDEESILNLAQEVLHLDGYEVVTARDGESGLRHLAQNRFDLTLCDWKMPGFSGQEVYERLAASNPEAARRVIFMSGDVINEKFQLFLQIHSKVCLTKPFSLQDLRGAVENAVSDRR